MVKLGRLLFKQLNSHCWKQLAVWYEQDVFSAYLTIEITLKNGRTELEKCQGLETRGRRLLTQVVFGWRSTLLHK